MAPCRRIDEYAYSLAKINGLERLQLDGPLLDEGLELILNGIPKLRELDVSGTAITYRSFAAIAKMPELEVLNITSGRGVKGCDPNYAEDPGCGHLSSAQPTLAAVAQIAIVTMFMSGYTGSRRLGSVNSSK